jgi:hypothetical protein
MRNRYEGDLDTYPDSTERARAEELEKKGVKFTNLNLEWGAKNRHLSPQLMALIGLIQRK